MRRASMISCLFALFVLLGAPGAAHAAVKLDVSASCVGNTLTGTVTITGVPAGTVVTVHAEAQTSGWAHVGTPASIVVVAGRSEYALALDVAGATGAKAFRVTADAGPGHSATSNHIANTVCGPPAQVPEAPAPLLIPATMVLTAVAVEVFRRRRPAGTRS